MNEWNYAVGQEASIKSINSKKFEPQMHGPHIILQTLTNGTVSARHAPHVAECMNVH